MTDEDQTIVTIPTELGRRDTWLIFGIAAAFIMYPLWAMLNGKAPVALCLAVILITAGWVVTNAPMAEVRGVGPFTVLVRNKLGERDVHEWALALAHYVRLVHIPVWRAWTYGRAVHLRAVWRDVRQGMVRRTGEGRIRAGILWRRFFR